jgi:hypothetical protein
MQGIESESKNRFITPESLENDERTLLKYQIMFNEDPAKYEKLKKNFRGKDMVKFYRERIAEDKRKLEEANWVPPISSPYVKKEIPKIRYPEYREKLTSPPKKSSKTPAPYMTPSGRLVPGLNPGDIPLPQLEPNLPEGTLKTLSEQESRKIGKKLATESSGIKKSTLQRETEHQIALMNQLSHGVFPTQPEYNEPYEGMEATLYTPPEPIFIPYPRNPYAPTLPGRETPEQKTFMGEMRSFDEEGIPQPEYDIVTINNEKKLRYRNPIIKEAQREIKDLDALEEHIDKKGVDVKVPNRLQNILDKVYSWWREVPKTRNELVHRINVIRDEDKGVLGYLLGRNIEIEETEEELLEKAKKYSMNPNIPKETYSYPKEIGKAMSRLYEGLSQKNKEFFEYLNQPSRFRGILHNLSEANENEIPSSLYPGQLNYESEVGEFEGVNQPTFLEKYGPQAIRYEMEVLLSKGINSYNELSKVPAKQLRNLSKLFTDFTGKQAQNAKDLYDSIVTPGYMSTFLSDFFNWDERSGEVLAKFNEYETTLENFNAAKNNFLDSIKEGVSNIGETAMGWWDRLKNWASKIKLPTASEIVSNVKNIIDKSGGNIAKGLLVSGLLALGSYAGYKLYNYVFPEKKVELPPRLENTLVPPPPPPFEPSFAPPDVNTQPKPYGAPLPTQSFYVPNIPTTVVPELPSTDLKLLNHMFQKPKTRIADHSEYVRAKIQNLIEQKIEMSWDYEGYNKRYISPALIKGY